MTIRARSHIAVAVGMGFIWSGALIVCGLAVGLGQAWLIPVCLLGAVVLQFVYSARNTRRRRGPSEDD